ncbi:SRPBCC domain-containing protein [Actinoplanes sp. NPDC023714]|uniref:SRPBCC domain-containing protein n=1 Tax=Actinoplanes sp. NPDC023714 TaxID=3154322 RepID=UPI0033E85908
MKITNEFVVHTPIDRAWRVLTDLEGVAPCMPGAQLTGVEGDVYQGRVKVKVGPVISDFTGTAQFTAKDDAAYRAVIDAKGRDARSAGNAAAVVTAWLTPSGDDSTRVNVETDLKISGKLAQFGSGMIKEVSGKLLAQFVANLEKKLAEDDAAAPAAAAASGEAAATAPGEAAPAVSGEAAVAAEPAPSAAAGAAPSASVGAAAAGGASVAEPVAEGGASAAAVETAPATGVALGSVAPGTPDSAGGITDKSDSSVPDPSAGEVEAAAGRTDVADGTPDPIAPLNVPEAELIKAGDSTAAAEARTETTAGASTTTPADPAAASGPATASGLATAAAGNGAVPATTSAAAATDRAAAGASGERKIESAEPEALDLLEVAGGSIYKRAIPVVVGVAVVAAVIVWAVARP